MRSSAGFSLVEVLIATTITVGITALACALAVDAQTVWRADSARVDLHQRARVAADMFARLLLESGAGPLTGSSRGPLLRVLAPVVPRRVGIRNADPPDVIRTDAISLLHSLADSEHATLLIAAAPSTATLDIAPAGCALPACGFTAGTTILVHDSTGNFDVFTITAVQGLTLAVRHHGTGNAAMYAAGSQVLAVRQSTLYWDRTARILREYDGDSSDFPLIDDVVGMEVAYAGDPFPPAWPRPASGQANCLYDSDGLFRAALLPVLEAAAAPVDLAAESLTDGPWCGSGGNQFDADLLRVRRIRVRLRFQAPDPAVRGRNPSLFRNPGTSTSRGSAVADVTIGVEVTPRNFRQGSE
jgi:hypothetical protein